MKPSHLWFAAGVAGLAVLAYLGRSQLKSVIINGADALKNKNVQAFLALIRKYESAGKYNVIYGGKTFADYSTHPNIRVPFRNPKTGRDDYSTAAGAYQIIYKTWLGVSALAGVSDFTPESQDAMAVWLLKGGGALTFIMSGDFNEALRRASGTWASLPYTDSKQKHISVAAAKAAYTQAGGALA